MAQVQIKSDIPSNSLDAVKDEIRLFDDFGKPTVEHLLYSKKLGVQIPVFVNEFWTSKQRAANSLHEVSYRACFKPQLPRFFIDRFTQPGDTVYDPFMGRGTTLLEAKFLGRNVIGCDINPLSSLIIEPRLSVPLVAHVEARLEELDLSVVHHFADEELLAFYHPQTLSQLISLQRYFVARSNEGKLDIVDKWIRMVATNRLTGHSPGFFSVYTLPPNQAVSADRQLKINKKRQQTPPVRDVKAIILKKTKALLKDVSIQANTSSQLLTRNCDDTPEIASGSVDLVVTSPPFLDVVDYQADNWLRCWFNGIDSKSIPIWQIKSPEAWIERISKVFVELERILVPNGVIAFEVGEIRGGQIKMELLVLDAANRSGLIPEFVLINDQSFTKTANCWGVSNAKKGTNTNRIVVLRKR